MDPVETRNNSEEPPATSSVESPETEASGPFKNYIVLGYEAMMIKFPELDVDFNL